MTSHELAKHLLAHPDLPVATHALGHDYFSVNDTTSHGQLSISICRHYTGDYIMIGNPYKRALNPPNWYIRKVLLVEPVTPSKPCPTSAAQAASDRTMCGCCNGKGWGLFINPPGDWTYSGPC